MLLEERSPSLITAEPHALDLGLFERVHSNGTNERYMDAKAPVNASAGEADENAEFRRRPLRVRGVAIAADVVVARLLYSQEL